MKYSIEEVLKFIEEEDVKFVRLAFPDAYGVQKNISVMAGEVKKAFEEGAPINARVIAGFKDCPYASLYLRPNPDTMAILPWRPDSGKVLRMFCNVYTPDGEEYVSDTRAILKQAVAAAEEKGIEFRFGNETEFYLFLKDEEGNPTRIPYDKAGYMDIAPLDKCENVRREIKKFGSTYQALTKGPVLDGVLPGPTVSPKACAELVATGAIVIIHKKNKASSLISGSRRTLSVICWLGEGLKCVKTSGNGRKGSA